MSYRKTIDFIFFVFMSFLCIGAWVKCGLSP